MSKAEAEKEEFDSVNRPRHYNTGTIQPIEFIESFGMGKAFCLGNAIKYIARHDHKHETKESQLEDLRKARWYLERAIAEVEAEVARGKER